MNLEQQFRKVVKGKNFMTPTVLGYYQIKDGVVELSYGTDFKHQPMFGVTVVQHKKDNPELSELFYDKKEAIAYIVSLQ